jgi:hypothetical protein
VDTLAPKDTLDVRLAARDGETDADTEADADELALKHVTCKSNTFVPPQGNPNIVDGVLKVHDGSPRHVVLDSEPDVAALQVPRAKAPHVPVGLP